MVLPKSQPSRTGASALTCRRGAGAGHAHGDRAHQLARTRAELAALAAEGDWSGGPELAPVPRCRPMHYTSGTSGRPKGVWSGLLTDAEARAVHEEEAAVWGLGEEDTQLICSPLYHSVAIRFGTQALLRGADVVLLERFDATTVAAAIGAMGVRSAFMVPTHLQRLLAGGKAGVDADLDADLLHGSRRQPDVERCGGSA